MSTIDKHVPGTVSWFDLTTPNIEEARKFYGALFGWEFDVGPAESGFHTNCRVGDRMAAGMGQPPPGSPFPSAWTVFFATEDIDADAARVKENGGQVFVGPMDVFGAGKMAVGSDPTGAMFGLWEPITHHGAGVVDQHGAMAWSEANTRDAEKTRDFYAATFRLEARPMEMPGHVYYTFHKDSKTVGGALQMDEKWPAEVPSHWLPYFGVDSTDDAVKTINENGGKVLHGPFNSPYGRIAVVMDPFGASFAVIQSSAGATGQ